jgi:hypothetical protein
MGDIQWHNIHITLQKNRSVARKHEMEDTHTHTHTNRRHDYLFSPIVTFYGINGEERLLNGYQVFAMIEQVSRVHRNKKSEDGSLEQTPEGNKEIK